MRVLYFDCFSGISGDMTLGALLDLGIDKDELLKELDKLNVDGFKIEVSKVKKNALEGTDVDVILKEHTHEHAHEHKHEHGEHHHHHHHEHRNYGDIEKIIDNSTLNENVKNMSKSMFMKVAKAEAKIHGTDIENIHFHEVGALDSIVDIVGAAICIDKLKVDKIISSPLHIGTGFIKCQHGLIPVPAPATLDILRQENVPVYSTGVNSELVTPTGATIIGTLAKEFGDMPLMTIEKIGYGTGKTETSIPNMLRAIIGEVKKKH